MLFAQRRRSAEEEPAETREPPGQHGLHLVGCAGGRVELGLLAV